MTIGIYCSCYQIYVPPLTLCTETLARLDVTETRCLRWSTSSERREQVRGPVRVHWRSPLVAAPKNCPFMFLREPIFPTLAVMPVAQPFRQTKDWLSLKRLHRRVFWYS